MEEARRRIGDKVQFFGSQYEALEEARQRLESEEGRQLYSRRAGIEGTISQGVRAPGFVNPNPNHKSGFFSLTCALNLLAVPGTAIGRGVVVVAYYPAKLV